MEVEHWMKRDLEEVEEEARVHWMEMRMMPQRQEAEGLA